MVKRKRVALIYSVNKGWIAGTYYILNLICALKTLSDVDKPIVVLVCSCKEDFEYVKTFTSYPYLTPHFSKQSYGVIKRVINKISRYIIGENYCTPRLEKIEANFVFPIQRWNTIHTCINRVFWIPDFQHKYLPDFFKKDDLNMREADFTRFAESGFPIVFSSMSAQSDFFKFYPHYKEKTTTFVLPFAVTLPDYSKVKIDEVRKKYAISDNGSYFFCANQFWKHKNHLRLFEAIREIRDLGYDIELVCSGSVSDYRNPEYFKQIEDSLKRYNLNNQIHILGFIDRCEQLCLIKHSLAVIQPSFEGWSTVIEDAKALNKHVLASNLDVHKEQLAVNVSFLIHIIYHLW